MYPSLELLETVPQVERAVRISTRYKFVRRGGFRTTKTILAASANEVGGEHFVMMAAPCSVDNEKQILETEHFVAKYGVKFLAWRRINPRTSPDDFEGMERAGLKLLQKANAETGINFSAAVFQT